MHLLEVSYTFQHELNVTHILANDFGKSRSRSWLDHFSIVKNKTVALHVVNMINPYLSFYIFQVAMSQCVDVP